MGRFRIILFGSERSGKTQLIKRFIEQKDYKFEEASYSTLGVDLKTKRLDFNNEILFCDLSGKEQFKSSIVAYYPGASVALLCVDLSKDPLEYQIRNQIQSFRDRNLLSPLIVVGTKADCDKNFTQKFKEIDLNDVSTAVFVTSAKADLDTEALLGCISKICMDQLEMRFQTAASSFLLAIKDLPADKYEKLFKELRQLKQQIFLNEPENNTEAKTNAIELFSKNCLEVLNNDYPYIANAMLVVAAAAVVTVLAGILGFGIGFALGAWSGPGAFISGLFAGVSEVVTVAKSSVVIGTATSTLVAYGLFKEPKEVSAVNDFVLDLKTSENQL